MSDAPAHLYRADWIDGHHMAQGNIWSGPSTEYIRADIHASRIAELERQLAEARDQALEDAALRIEANPDPCSPAYPSAWTDDQILHYESGQLDSANSFAYAIRAMKGAKP